MLRIIEQKSSAQVKSYYERSDYYEEGPNALKGHWFGQAAKRLGLVGEVDKKAFDRVVDNLHPSLEESLTPRTRVDRRIGWDLTFSVSKSVSILWALTQDHRILDTVKEAVNETLEEIERDVLTRVHQGRSMHTEKPGNITAATWLHTTSRPVNGVAMPQLHVHAWLANHCFFGDSMRAIDISGVKKDGPWYEARFHSRLAAKLQERFELGIERRGKKWFEVKGIGREVIERYSERLKQIEAAAKEKGIVSAAEKATLGARTREAKSKAIEPNQLPRLWQEKLFPGEAEMLARRVEDAGKHAESHDMSDVAVLAAIDHKMERQSSVREREISTEALWRGVGKSTPASIDRALASQPLIRDGVEEHCWVSTRQALKEEQAMLDFVRKGKGAMLPIASEHTIGRDWLSQEQKEAVRDLLNCKDQVVLLAGKAGVGKTTVASEFVEGARSVGMEVLMTAPTTKAVGVLEKDGFAAVTLAKLLNNQEMQAESRGKTVWLDEAGLVSTPDMAKLLGLAERQRFRVVLSGDKFQHASIGRGQVIDLLQREAGLRTIGISKIRRQLEKAYRNVVATLSRGEVRLGLDGLERLGAIREVADDATRNQLIAQRYVEGVDSGDSVLVIAPSIAEKEAVTQAIREKLRADGRVGGQEISVHTLKAYGWTKAEREDACLYRPGDVIEFHAKGRGGFKPGDRAIVRTIDDDRVMVDAGGGAQKVLPLASSGSFEVFEPAERQFATGDVIKITRSRRAKPGQTRLNNGQRFAIQGIGKDGEIRLGGGINLDSKWGHFEHGVVSTSYSSQGDTSDRVLIAQSSKSFGASSPEQLYVSVSRGRKQMGLEIFTDNREGLMRAVAKERPAMSATELARRAATAESGGRVKQQIDRLRHAVKTSRDFMQQHMRRLAHLLPHRIVQQPSRS